MEMEMDMTEINGQMQMKSTQKRNSSMKRVQTAKRIDRNGKQLWLQFVNNGVMLFGSIAVMHCIQPKLHWIQAMNNRLGLAWHCIKSNRNVINCLIWLAYRQSGFRSPKSTRVYNSSIRHGCYGCCCFCSWFGNNHSIQKFNIFKWCARCSFKFEIFVILCLR